MTKNISMIAQISTDFFHSPSSSTRMYGMTMNRAGSVARGDEGKRAERKLYRFSLLIFLTSMTISTRHNFMVCSVWLFDDGIKKSGRELEERRENKSRVVWRAGKNGRKNLQGDFSRRIIKHHQMILEYAFLDDAWLSLTHFFSASLFFLLLLSCWMPAWTTAWEC